MNNRYVNPAYAQEADRLAGTGGLPAPPTTPMAPTTIDVPVEQPKKKVKLPRVKAPQLPKIKLPAIKIGELKVSPKATKELAVFTNSFTFFAIVRGAVPKLVPALFTYGSFLVSPIVVGCVCATLCLAGILIVGKERLTRMGALVAIGYVVAMFIF